jgi:hypothetical protein
MDDIEFENFWFTLKRNMLNYYNDEKKINEWSNVLNSLKEKREYHSIQINILKYLCEMARDLLKNYNSRIAEIFLVNLKRWNKIINKCNFLDKYNFYNYLLEFNKLKARAGIMIKLYENLEYGEVKEYYTEQNNYREYLTQKEPEFIIDKVLKLAIKIESATLLENLATLYDMNNYILINYGINTINTKLTKVIYQLKDKIEV